MPGVQRIVHPSSFSLNIAHFIYAVKLFSRTRDCKGGEAVVCGGGFDELNHRRKQCSRKAEPWKARFFAKQKIAPDITLKTLTHSGKILNIIENFATLWQNSQFRIRPFVFKEILEYAKELNKEVSITDYLVWGGFPKIFEFSSLQEKRRYITDLDETIVMNYIINRYKIKKSVEFKKVANYILVSNARIYSAKSICDYMKGNGTILSSNTVQKWISYLAEAYVIDQIQRYSTRAKKELEQSQKLYNCDVSLNSIRCINNRFDLTHNLENIVYNELLYIGFSVCVYDNRGREIDFIAEKDNKKYFIQVAYSVAEDKAYEREFSAFNLLSQIDKKIIITNDEIDYSTSNVEHIKLKDFLLMEDL